MCPLRPDIHATKELTRTLQQPNLHDQKNLQHLLRYLHNTRKYKLHLRVRPPGGDDTVLIAYSDSDWAGCQTMRKSKPEKQLKPTIYADSNSAKGLGTQLNGSYTKRTKHVDTRYLQIDNKVLKDMEDKDAFATDWTT
eukprot:192350-Amphidinium_carterae.1